MTEIYLMLEAGEQPWKLILSIIQHFALHCAGNKASHYLPNTHNLRLYIKSFIKEEFSFFDIFQIELNPTKAGKHYSVSSNFTGLKSFHRKVDWLKS